MFSRSTKFLIGSLAIGGSLMVVLLIGFNIREKEAARCEIFEKEPWPDPICRRNVASPDNTVLVNLDAYLKYPSHSSDLFALLSLINVTVSYPRYNSTQVDLQTGCAKVTLDLSQNNGMQVLDRIVVDATNVISAQKRCHVNFPTPVIFNRLSTHYACNREQRFTCYESRDGKFLTSKPVFAELVIYKIEYEIDGNSWMIEQALFSKPAEYCSDGSVGAS